VTPITDTLGGGSYDAASAINNNNVVAGWADYSDSGNLRKRAFSYAIGGSMRNLGLPATGSWDQSWAWAIGGNGDVGGFVCIHNACGFPGDTGTNIRLAMVYNASTMTMTDIGTLGGGTSDYSETFGVNSSRVAVGYSTNIGRINGQTAFVWDSTNGMKQLFALADASDFTDFYNARAIDDNGNIVGDGPYSDGKVHAFLATPYTPHTPIFDDNPAVAALQPGLLVTAQPTADQSAGRDASLAVPRAQIGAAATNPVAADGSPVGERASVSAVDHFWLRELDASRQDWWHWEGANLF
jgi:hypothetical protein